MKSIKLTMLGSNYLASSYLNTITSISQNGEIHSIGTSTATLTKMLRIDGKITNTAEIKLTNDQYESEILHIEAIYKDFELIVDNKNLKILESAMNKLGITNQLHVIEADKA